MRPNFPFSFQPRQPFARFFGFAPVFLALAFPALAAPPAPLATANAPSTDASRIATTLEALRAAAGNRDVDALGFYGAGLPADNAPLEISARTTHTALSAAGALVRQQFTVSIRRTPPVTLSSGVHDLWLSRATGGGFALSKRFAAPPDALAALSVAADEEARAGAESSVLDLVATRVGGRWIALRRQRWEGEIGTSLRATASARDFVEEQMKAAPETGAVTGHFLLQRSDNPARAWIGVGAAFDPAKRVPAAADALAAAWRQRAEGDGFSDPRTHRDFALALRGVGLWNESADELQKAKLLAPTLVSAGELREAESGRARDPQNLVARQQQQEREVGLGTEHPTYLINALKREQQAQPSAIGALRLALEYSRLADDSRALAWMKSAAAPAAQRTIRPQDAQWIPLLLEHLRERTRLSRIKPSNIVRSDLWTVRVWPGDPGAVTLLAALEEAQHTVYADFGIPMGNTEVLLWRSQEEFARYTTQFSDQGASEFVAALTLTKLVSTINGPWVLGEEINSFADAREPEALFSTLAHEYGHVAVRQLSRGRLVPVWFNEGVASSVEGGYDGYIARVRRAANAGTWLSMREMTTWNVDGERAFLAYSQANSLVDYIVARWGKNAVLEILRQIGRDTPPDDAFRGVLGLTQTALWNAWAREGIR